MDDTIGRLVFFALCIVAISVYLIARHAADEKDRARRQANREAYDQREQQKAKAALLAEIDRYFPFLHEAYRNAVAAGQGPEEAFWDAIENTPTVELGTTFYGLPALLPLDERRKHVYIVGKPGQGKTTLLLNLINDDLIAGRGVGVIAPEAEMFRDWLLPMIPDERIEDVVYFAPGDPKNRITFNPLALEGGDDQVRAAGDLFAIFKRAVGEEEIGARMAPILSNAFKGLVGRPGATLWDVKRLLEDAEFRAEIAKSVEDEYLREFWLKTYPSYPKGSHLPVINRLDQFLGPIPVRRALCHPISSLSIRRVLAEKLILLVDLSGLASDDMLILGQMVLAKFQLELHRREVMRQEQCESFYLFCDEFQEFAGVAEGTWRGMLSRGRRYGLALTLGHQHPSQLPTGLRDEISGTVSSMVIFNVAAKDAQVLRNEFLEEAPGGGEARPVTIETFITLKKGQAMARLGTGAFAIPLRTRKPLADPPAWRGEKVREASWERYGAPPFTDRREAPDDDAGKKPPEAGEDFLE